MSIKDITIQAQLWQDCNLKCKHCWRDAKMDIEKLNTDKISRKISNFILKLNKSNQDYFFTINLSWWEILLYPEKLVPFLKLLDKFDNLKIWLLTNWTIWNEKINSILEKYKYRIYLQISIDWLEKDHDFFRWKWSFQKSVNNSYEITNKWYQLLWQTVLSSYNEKNIDDFLDFFLNSPIYRLSIRKILETGRAINFDKNTTIIEQRNIYLKSFLNKLEKKLHLFKEKDKELYLWCDAVALPMLNNNVSNFTGKCWVYNKSIIWIEPNWDIYLCPRLPIRIWNIYKHSLNKSYNKYDKILKKKLTISNKCAWCQLSNKCISWDLCEIYQHYWDLKSHSSLICI